jgi:hypothetical protein
LLVITTPEAVDSPGMDVQFSAELADQLRAVDYEHNIAIVVFRGLLQALSPRYTVDILQVVRSGNQVVVQTHLGVPGPEQGSLSSFSSPYHVIAVPRQGMQEQEIRFILEVDGQMANEHTYFIPKPPTATDAFLSPVTGQEVELPFETIERAEFGWQGVLYQGKQPRLDVITGTEDVNALDGTISPDAQAQLQAVDFNEYLVLAAFQGWRPSLPTPSGVEVQRITWNENTNTITIDVHLYEYVEGTVEKDVVISAYHLVKVQKNEKMSGEMEFALSVDGIVVSQQTRRLP